MLLLASLLGTSLLFQPIDACQSWSQRNIVLKRTDDLWFVKEAGFLWLFGGQVNKNVRTVTVNGKEDFKADEEVYLDGQIILLVNTYNGDTYEGM